MSDAEVNPRYYRHGDMSACFKGKDRFSVQLNGKEIAGTHNHAAYRSVLEDLLTDESLSEANKASVAHILDATKRSLYDHYVVVTGEEISIP